MNEQNDKYKRRERIQNIREAMNATMGFEMGKLPPQSCDMEEAVLGAMMLETNGLKIGLSVLTSEMMYKEEHKLIFIAIESLSEKSSPVDILTVTQELRKLGTLERVGGGLYISQLTNKVASSANLEVHSRIVAEKYMLRKLIEFSHVAINESYEEMTDVFDLIEETIAKLQNLKQETVGEQSTVTHVSEVIAEANMDMERRLNSEQGGSKYIMGINSVDRLVGGWQQGDLIYLAARPSMGKSSVMLCAAYHLALQGIPVAIFSLEMPKRQLLFRLCSLDTGIDLQVMVKGKLDPMQQTEYYKSLDRIKKLPIYIEDKASLSVFGFADKMRHLVEKHNCEIAFLDYVQLMTVGKAASKKMSTNGNRDQELGIISRTLKETAKDLNIPVVALAQLSRAVETRAGEKRPLLADLRESGNLEQDADLIAFLYRPEYYGVTADAEGNSTQGIAEFIIAKHRNGALGTAIMKFIAYIAKFTNQHEVEKWKPAVKQHEHSDKRVEGLPANEKFLNKSNNSGDGSDAPF